MRARSSSVVVLSAASLVAGCWGEHGPPLVVGSARLASYQSCADLERDLEDLLIAEADKAIERMADDRYGGGGLPPGEDTGADPGTGNDSGGGRQEGVDYSGTNNQEDGVDEADFVKTDGYHVYTLNGNRLHIFGVPEFGELVPASVTSIEGYPAQMLLDRDAGKVAVFSIVMPEQLPDEHPLKQSLGQLVDGQWRFRTWSVTKITVLDVSDPGAPSLEAEVFLEAYYQTAREQDGSVRVITYSWMEAPALWSWYQFYYDHQQDVVLTKQFVRQEIRALTLDDLIPRLYLRTPDGTLTPAGLDEGACRDFARPAESHGRGFTSIISFDLVSDSIAWDADHVLSNWPTVYASRDLLVLAEPQHDWWWFWDANAEIPDATNLHGFDLSRAGETRYVGSGRVDGLLFDQFSLDEQDGFVRVATTSNLFGRWWLENPPPVSNNVFVLAPSAGSFQVVGAARGIAPDERIFSARFQGDRGYLVTFEQIDPLFTLDLSNPYAPRVVGELEIFGFSTYLHPIADDKLLSIGVGGDETGANWRTQVSLFDVGDFAHPALDDVEVLVGEDGWGWSEALYEHKAFQYWAPKQLLAVPLSTYRWHENGGPEGYGWYEWLSRLELIRVDPATGLSRHGTIDHSHLYNQEPGRWWYYGDVRRSIFMGEFVYAISDAGISVHAVDTLDRLTEQRLPGYDPADRWWWW